MAKQIVEVINTCRDCTHCDTFINTIKDGKGNTNQSVWATCDKSDKELPIHGKPFIGSEALEYTIPPWCALSDYKEESPIIIPGR
jgi:hypothetical protein